MRKLICGIIMASATMVNAAQNPKNLVVKTVYSYADIADLALASEQTAHVKIRKAKKLSQKLAPKLPKGVLRYIVTADVLSLIRGKGGIEPRITYLVDVQTDSLGRAESLRGREMFIFAKRVGASELQLVRPDGELPWSPEAAAMLRRILTEAVNPDAPPAIRSISAAFHTEGNLPGEGESQIFLEAEDDRPVSISVTRSIGTPVNWFVSVGDLVAEGRTPPKQNTLLWYRLACFLPETLPAGYLEGKSTEEVSALGEDYAVVKTSLGPCRRERPPLPNY